VAGRNPEQRRRLRGRSLRRSEHTPVALVRREEYRADIRRWLEVFITRFVASQFKRSALFNGL
jgi:hypothetical protein